VMALRNLKLESAPRFLCILHACSDTLSHFVTVTLWLQFLLLSQDASYFSRLRSQELARPTCSDWARIRVVYERSRMDEGTIFRTRESRHDLGHHLASPFVRPDLLRHLEISSLCIQEPGNPASEVDGGATSALVETGPRPLRGCSDPGRTPGASSRCLFGNLTPPLQAAFGLGVTHVRLFMRVRLI